MAKSLHAFSLVFALGLIMGSMVMAQPVVRQQKIKTIIIDAGHGGTDPGARGEYSTEAQITLQIAQRLDTLLRNEITDTRIVMTRNTDVYHSVTEKANFANRENGDLFVCIHVNAAPPKKTVTGYKSVPYYKGKGSKRKKYYRKVPIYATSPNPAHGTSTYVWAADRSDEKAKGIIEDWSQKFFKNSVKLASMIEDEFVAVGRKSSGVLQRNHMGIWVLQATNMPAVLIETGFITDKDEEAYLNSESGQVELTRSIANAVLKYKAMVDGR